MSKLPKSYTRFLETYPSVANAYHQLGEALSTAGPLDEKTRELVKLAIAVGARVEGSVKSHARRAREAGASLEEIHHVVLLSTTTIGFANMMAGLSWVKDVLEEEEEEED
jgi:AhpD family alkylhydroperoxidase